MRRFLFLTAVLLLSITFQVDAQQQQQQQQRPQYQQKGPRERMTPEQQAARSVEFIHKQVNLTEEQQKELKTWFTEANKKNAEAFQKSREGGREAMMAQMKKSHEEADAQLKKVLTQEQYKKYHENMEKFKQQRQQRPQGPRGTNGRPAGNRGGGFPRN